MPAGDRAAGTRARTVIYLQHKNWTILAIERNKIRCFDITACHFLDNPRCTAVNRTIFQFMTHFATSFYKDAALTTASRKQHSSGSCTMRTRDLFWLSAASATCIAIINCISISSALAKESCVTTPGSETEPGTHWYYRVDRATNRQCWYSKRLQGTTPAKGSTESALSRNAKTGPVRRRTPVTVESSVDKRDIPRTPPRQEKGSTVLPVDVTERDVLFRQFLEWYQRELVGTELQNFLGHRQEESSR
jgi:hypothetical protein